MLYGSICSGIEAATVAWSPLGWKADFFSEIEKFPSTVLGDRYPDVPNLGDMTSYKEWPDATIDVLVGGTPCQSYSVAGLRAGLDDPRGDLMLTYVAIARKYRPKWVVWENVPGVLSSNEGRDFGSLLGLLTGQQIECPPDGWKNSGIVPGYKSAYGIAWRVLDAQYFGVPQRRRRVFLIGYLGDWRSAAAVLFERHSLSGDPAPSRKKGQEVTGTITKCSFSGGAEGRPEGAAGNHFLPVGIDEEGNATIDGFGPLLRGGGKEGPDKP
jgi:DNA (cytosine-5)-methyltransferase 1